VLNPLDLDLVTRCPPGRTWKDAGAGCCRTVWRIRVARTARCERTVRIGQLSRYIRTGWEVEATHRMRIALSKKRDSASAIAPQYRSGLSRTSSSRPWRMAECVGDGWSADNRQGLGSAANNSTIQLRGGTASENILGPGAMAMTRPSGGRSGPLEPFGHRRHPSVVARFHGGQLAGVDLGPLT